MFLIFLIYTSTYWKFNKFKVEKKYIGFFFIRSIAPMYYNFLLIIKTGRAYNMPLNQNFFIANQNSLYIRYFAFCIYKTYFSRMIAENMLVIDHYWFIFWRKHNHVTFTTNRTLFIQISLKSINILHTL